MKLKWKVDSVPVGRYRSFDTRGWPQAFYVSNDRLAATVHCVVNGVTQEYRPNDVKDGTHPSLTVRVADHSRGMQDRKWWKLTGTFATLADAKAATQKCLDAHPEFEYKEAQ